MRNVHIGALVFCLGSMMGAAVAQPEADDEALHEDSVTVRAPNYVSTGSRTATKSDAPLLETPQSVTVISRDQIDLLNWTSLQQSVRYTAGAVGENFGPDERYDWLTLRGFNPVQYIDGLQAPVGSVTNVGTDLYGFEAVDILKGPSSVLYGQAPPGGIVNMTSRRPENRTRGEFGGQLGNYSHKQFNADMTGPLTDRTYGRLTLLYRDRGTQVDFMDSQRLFIAPALTFEPGAATRITLLSYFQRDEIANPSTGFLPAAGTALPNVNGRIPVGRNLGEPGVNFYDRDQYGVGYDFEHAFAGGFVLQQNLKLFNSATESRAVFGTGFVDANADGVPDDFRTVTRSDFPFNEDVRSFNVDTRGSFEFGEGAIRHSLLFGIDYRRYTNQSEFGFGAAPSIDVFTPVYGAPLPAPVLFPFANDVQKQTGVYVQDQARVGRWVVTLSGRQDWVRSELPGGAPDRKDDEFSYRFGVNYVFDNGFAPYAQTARSFQPVAGADFDGNRFVPSTGSQVEAGLKFSDRNPGADLRFFGSAAIYRLVQENVLTPDPDPTRLFFSVQTGEVEVDGIELEAVARWRERLSLHAAYARTNSEVTRSNGPNLGKNLPMVPENTLSLLADYVVSGGRLAGFGYGLGLRHLGGGFGDPANLRPTESVTLFDAQVHYNYGEWRLALNASNLADREYVARCSSAADCFYGTRRIVVATVTRSF